MMNCATRGAAPAAAGACPAERPAAPLRQVPGEGLERTEVSINAPGTHHVVADRLDVTKRSAGVNRFEWGAPESKLGMDIAVHALEGSGARSAPRAHERLARWLRAGLVPTQMIASQAMRPSSPALLSPK